jgi:hypothetical protein
MILDFHVLGLRLALGLRHTLTTPPLKAFQIRLPANTYTPQHEVFKHLFILANPIPYGEG